MCGIGNPQRATLDSDTACVGIPSLRTYENDGEKFYKAEYSAEGFIHGRHDGTKTAHLGQEQSKLYLNIIYLDTTRARTAPK